MKLSISLPDEMALELKSLSEKSERPLSWWIQKAWLTAKPLLKQGNEQRLQQKAMKRLSSLRGSLKNDYPNEDSVSLSHRAFEEID
jgi:hypothetical protein